MNPSNEKDPKTVKTKDAWTLKQNNDVHYKVEKIRGAVGK